MPAKWQSRSNGIPREAASSTRDQSASATDLGSGPFFFTAPEGRMMDSFPFPFPFSPFVIPSWWRMQKQLTPKKGHFATFFQILSTIADKCLK
jgi:hypothetical protein